MIPYETAYSIAVHLSQDDKKKLANALLKDLEPEKPKHHPLIEKQARRIQLINLKKYKK